MNMWLVHVLSECHSCQLIQNWKLARFILVHCMAPKFCGEFLVLSLLNDMGYSIMFQFVLIVYKK